MYMSVHASVAALQRCYLQHSLGYPRPQTHGTRLVFASLHAAQMRNLLILPKPDVCALCRTLYVCIFSQQYRINMDIGNSENYLGIIAVVTIT